MTKLLELINEFGKVAGYKINMQKSVAFLYTNKELSEREIKKMIPFRDFPGGPVVKNPPSNAGDVGSIPGRGTKIPHAVGQLSPRTKSTELARLNERACVPQTTEPMHSGAHAPQLQSPCALEPVYHN